MRRSYVYPLLVAIAMTSSSLSLLGSSFIIYIAVKRRNQFFHRIMICLSVSDIIVSTATLLQPFLIPNETSSLSFGNERTCSFLGFLMRFPAAVAIFNCYLSVYFSYAVRNGCPDNFSVGWEITMILFGFAVPIAFGLSGVITHSFHPLDVLEICDYGPPPALACDNGNELECPSSTEDNYDHLRQDWPYVSVIVLASTISIGCTVSVILYVRKRTKANLRHSFVSDSNTTTLKDVATQAVLFIVAYLNGFIWSAATRITFDKFKTSELEDDQLFLVLVFLAYAFFPLQGFWNSFIYIRPRYLIWRKLEPAVGSLWAFKKVLTSVEPLRSRSSRRSFGRSLSRRPSSNFLRNVSSGSAEIGEGLRDVSSKLSGNESFWRSIVRVTNEGVRGMGTSRHGILSVGTISEHEVSFSQDVRPASNEMDINIPFQMPPIQGSGEFAVENVDDNKINGNSTEEEKEPISCIASTGYPPTNNHGSDSGGAAIRDNDRQYLTVDGENYNKPNGGAKSKSVTFSDVMPTSNGNEENSATVSHTQFEPEEGATFHANSAAANSNAAFPYVVLERMTKALSIGTIDASAASETNARADLESSTSLSEITVQVNIEAGNDDEDGDVNEDSDDGARLPSHVDEEESMGDGGDVVSSSVSSDTAIYEA